jgi:hypothetical protein
LGHSSLYNENFWLQLGAAFAHKDGKGFDIILDAQPIPQDGKIRISLRMPKED